MTAVDVQSAAQLVKLRMNGLGRIDRQPSDLHGERRLVLLHRSADQNHVAASRIADQQDGELQARQRGSGTVRQVDKRRR